MHHGMLHVDRKHNDDQVQWFCAAHLDAHVLRGARRQSEGSGGDLGWTTPDVVRGLMCRPKAALID